MANFVKRIGVDVPRVIVFKHPIAFKSETIETNLRLGNQSLLVCKQTINLIHGRGRGVAAVIDLTIRAAINLMLGNVGDRTDVELRLDGHGKIPLRAIESPTS